MMNLATATPTEIDTEIARIWEQEQKIGHYLKSTQQTLAKWAEEEKQGRDFFPQRADYEAKVVKFKAELKALRAEAKPFEAEYERRRWSRFFLVTNQNGHIHTSMSCSTCFHDTQFGWLPQYSGMTAEEIVAVEDYRCCTVCMPIAPAEQKAAAKRRTAAEKAKRQAERDAKQAAKDAKARERTVKLFDKVEAWLDDFGREAYFALPQRGAGGNYEAIHGFGKFEGRKPAPSTVGNMLSGLHDLHHGDKQGVYARLKPIEREEAIKRGFTV